MTAPGVVLAVDVGTSGARAFSYDERYVIQAAAGGPITTMSGADGSSTRAWEQVRSAIAGSIREVTARSLAPVAALVLSGTASCLVPCWPDRGDGHSGSELRTGEHWTQLVTDALGVVTSVPEPAEATATGAAVLGWLALGRPEPRPPLPARATRERSPDGAAHAELAAKSTLMRELRACLFPRP